MSQLYTSDAVHSGYCKSILLGRRFSLDLVHRMFLTERWEIICPILSGPSSFHAIWCVTVVVLCKVGRGMKASVSWIYILRPWPVELMQENLSDITVYLVKCSFVSSYRFLNITIFGLHTRHGSICCDVMVLTVRHLSSGASHNEMSVSFGWNLLEVWHRSDRFRGETRSSL